ncbi:hypothetical protein KDX38_14110 [Pseudomonas sp. CDFA 602]|uniref:hypothetical protein n=1 Tax=Pseudomonas californiensis TaxID=2829823 RepID=UPI001E57D31F|nr:hypothetical protein [Pseudomonas californiensis]MCD5994667.1 hypothetical protein [Pseudomonas californiensis]MCD6000348.1 hypothetical protein [Pseudomonas californiensis]
MQDENEVDTRKKIAVHSMPCELIVPGFTDEYSAYLRADGADGFGYGFVTILGFILLVLGGVTILLGPDSIWLAYGASPTFFEYIQLYPGPIATIGGLLLAFGKSIDSHDANLTMTPEQFLVSAYQLSLPENTDLEKTLTITHVEAGLFELDDI